MKKIVEVVELIVGSQYIFFTPFFSPNFFSGKLIRKNSHKIKIKRIQKL